jgi:hypothetical protein
MIETPIIVTSSHRLSPQQWQAGIDAEDFLVQLTLNPEDAARLPGLIRADLGGNPISHSYFSKGTWRT